MDIKQLFTVVTVTGFNPVLNRFDDKRRLEVALSTISSTEQSSRILSSWADPNEDPDPMDPIPHCVDLLHEIVEKPVEFFSDLLGGVVLPEKPDEAFAFRESCSIEDVPKYCGVVIMRLGVAATIRIPMYFQVVNVFGGPYDESREPPDEGA